MVRKYTPCIDNYVLSIHPEEGELWRNELQLLYTSMKLSVVDPVVIDEQYYDMHEEFSDENNDDFDATVGSVIVGIRKMVYDDFIPKFIEHHRKFLSLIEQLSPDMNVSQEEHSTVAREIVSSYKNVIDGIKEVREQHEDRYKDVLKRVPNEFGLVHLVEKILRSHEHHVDCFRYPRCGGVLTEDYAASLGDYVIFKDRIENLKKGKLIFLADDEPYIEDVYLGFLSSYKARIRFVSEVMENIDLIRLRETKC